MNGCLDDEEEFVVESLVVMLGVPNRDADLEMLPVPLPVLPLFDGLVLVRNNNANVSTDIGTNSVNP
jgi:hypothetical protein